LSLTYSRELPKRPLRNNMPEVVDAISARADFSGVSRLVNGMTDRVCSVSP
jgi:hypothetical protein